MAGRPRSTECDRAILQATLVEYGARGLEALSVDAVAARAGVGKATIYRRYPSKLELVMAAALMLCEESAPRLDAESLEHDLREYLGNLARRISDPVFGAAKRALLFDAATNDDLAQMHRTIVASRREQIFEMLRGAIARGEMRADADLEFAADELSAPLFYRNLLVHSTIDDAYIDKVVTAFLDRYGTQADQAGLRPESATSRS